MTDVGGVSDIVVDGETGFLLPPDDVNVLTERLRYLVARPDVRHRMGIAARAQAEAKFDASKNGEKVADILLEVASAQNRTQ
jgi:glycosyltransferase involved in cell wall biosynthesis